MLLGHGLVKVKLNLAVEAELVGPPHADPAPTLAHHYPQHLRGDVFELLRRSCILEVFAVELVGADRVLDDVFKFAQLAVARGRGPLRILVLLVTCLVLEGFEVLL